jgi:alkylation response protein AidB-like acyl-CoA dehydrogenase
MMIGFELSEEQEQLRRTVEQFAHEVVAPVIGDLYDRGEFPYDIVAGMGKMGLFGLPFPEEYGGMGGDYFALCLALEELARVDSSVAITLEAGVSLGAMPIYRFGTAEQKQKLLPQLTSGERLAAFGLTEPGGGSDASATATTARLEDGEWVLNGSKMWCSFAHKASHVLIVCRSERGDNPHEGMSMIFVPRGAEGFTITPIQTLGGEDTNELHLDDVRAPESALLGSEGAGWTQLMAGLNNERVILGATALGLAQRAFDDALAYAKERRQFGRPVGTFQALQHKFAEMATDLTRTRLLVHWVARMTDEDPQRMLPQEASMAKLAATELAKRCALDGLQIMGGYGYATEYPMERHLRQAVVTTIYGGTSEIQKNIIAKTLGL